MMKTPEAHPWPIYGHDWAVDHLRKSIANERVRHAYLFSGTDSIGKTTLARSFAMALNCTAQDLRPCGECRSCRLIASRNHPDIIATQPDPQTGTLKIEEIRNVIQSIALKPYEARYRIAILGDFDRARPTAQDAILKTLEEPPPYALIMLLAESAEDLLPTIRSRTQTLHLQPIPTAEVRSALIQGWKVEEEYANLLAQLSGGRLGWAVNALSRPEALDQRREALDILEDLIQQNRVVRFARAEQLAKDKLALFPLLDLWQSYWRDAMLVCAGSADWLANHDRKTSLTRLAGSISLDDAQKALLATRTALKSLDQNVNTRLAIEVMFLDYPGLVRA